MTMKRSALLKREPRNILLLKTHSAGIGDLLRSSAAWRALRNRFPDARLHLWFLTKDPGASSELLIGRHHLLASFRVSDKRTHGYQGWRRLLREGRDSAREVGPDLIIDCEPNGLRTSLLALYVRFLTGARTVGIAQQPFRGCFYNRSAPSTRAYLRERQMPPPLEYTERDFVALAALGIERNGTAIELHETEEGRIFRRRLEAELGSQNAPPVLGLNIGCGTPDADAKRPNLDLLAALVSALQRRYGFSLLLTGASFERDINREFLARLQPVGPVLDLAGRTNILELTGAISACRLFVSSDSGPYHMSVALRVPTLALFAWPSPEHYHRHSWVHCQATQGVQSPEGILEAAQRLLELNPRGCTGPTMVVAGGN
jgi:ADP-heptose:LPS heptosyltransferase